MRALATDNDSDRGSLSKLGFDGNGPAVTLNEPLDDGQPHTRAVRTRAEKQVARLVDRGLRHACALVDDLKTQSPDVVFVASNDATAKQDSGLARAMVDGISDELAEGFGDADLIETPDGARGLIIDVEFDGPCIEKRQGGGPGGVGKIGKRRAIEFELLDATVREDLGDAFVEPIDLLHEIAEEGSGLSRLGSSFDQLRTRSNSGQRIT